MIPPVNPIKKQNKKNSTHTLGNFTSSFRNKMVAIVQKRGWGLIRERNATGTVEPLISEARLGV